MNNKNDKIFAERMEAVEDIKDYYKKRADEVEVVIHLYEEHRNLYLEKSELLDKHIEQYQNSLVKVGAAKEQLEDERRKLYSDTSMKVQLVGGAVCAFMIVFTLVFAGGIIFEEYKKSQHLSDCMGIELSQDRFNYCEQEAKYLTFLEGVEDE